MTNRCLKMMKLTCFLPLPGAKLKAMKHYGLVDGPIPHSLLGEILTEIHHRPDLGGIAIFLGQVRADATEDDRVVALEYQVYEPLIAERMQSLLAWARKQGMEAWIFHSRGLVRAGEPGFLVVVAAPHRTGLFEALQQLVARAKRELPIWKKEHLASGKTRWIQTEQIVHP